MKLLKKIYFVRHAETKLNVALKKDPDLYHHQTATDPLTENGKNQARILAERLKNIDFEYIIASPFERASHTAEIINKVHDKGIEISQLFVEVVPPKEFNGMRITDPEIQLKRRIMHENANDPDWRFSNEENFHDRKSRARKALSFISEHREQKILVVTHGAFLKVLGAYIIFGDDLKPHEYYKFNQFTSLSNTGISVCNTYDNGNWKIVSWNDTSHLN